LILFCFFGKDKGKYKNNKFKKFDISFNLTRETLAPKTKTMEISQKKFQKINVGLY